MNLARGLLMVAVGLIACSEPLPPLPLCAGTHTMTVSPNPLTFSWDEACGFGSLIVMEEGNLVFGVKWVIGDAAKESLRSPIRYGVVPPGATVTVPSTALSIGTTYRVTASHGDGSGVATAMATTTFVR